MSLFEAAQEFPGRQECGGNPLSGAAAVAYNRVSSWEGLGEPVVESDLRFEPRCGCRWQLLV